MNLSFPIAASDIIRVLLQPRGRHSRCRRIVCEKHDVMKSEVSKWKRDQRHLGLDLEAVHFCGTSHVRISTLENSF